MYDPETTLDVQNSDDDSATARYEQAVGEDVNPQLVLPADVDLGDLDSTDEDCVDGIGPEDEDFDGGGSF